MNDCADYDEEHCGPCPEYGGTKEVGCYKPINKKTEPVAKLQCSDGLDGLVSELRTLSADNEKKYCKEDKDRFAEGRFEGKMEAYDDCIEKITTIMRQAD